MANVQQFQTNNPFDVALNAAAQYLGGVKQNDQDKQTREDQLASAKQAQDNADRSFGLEQNADTRAQTGQKADIAHQGFEEGRETASDKVTAEANKYAISRRKIQEKIDALNIQAQSNANNAAQIALINAKIKNETDKLALSDAKFTSGLTRKYGQKQADLGIQQLQANISSTNASTNASNASAEETHARTGLIGQQTTNLKNGIGLNSSKNSSKSTIDRTMPPGLSPSQQKEWKMYYGVLQREQKNLPRKTSMDADGNQTSEIDTSSPQATRVQQLQDKLDSIEGLSPESSGNLTGKTNPVNSNSTNSGQTVVATDGHTYQQQPNGKWQVIK